jgi:hypothetical protein
MGHSHNHCCEHELAWCRACAVVYCKKCGKEWKEDRWTITTPHMYTKPNYTSEWDVAPYRIRT